MMKPERPLSIHIIPAIIVLSIILMVNGNSSAYVMPVEQILDLMDRNFKRVKTLVITQSTRLKADPATDEVFTFIEKIKLKAPGRYAAESDTPLTDTEMTGPILNDRPPGGDMTFRLLLMPGTLDEKKAFLSHLGIDITSILFARFEGTVVYQLGKSTPGSPKLLIERDTFLPVFFSYHTMKDSIQVLANVRFEGYEEIQKGRYPFIIEYSLKWNHYKL